MRCPFRPDGNGHFGFCYEEKCRAYAPEEPIGIENPLYPGEFLTTQAYCKLIKNGGVIYGSSSIQAVATNEVRNGEERGSAQSGSGK